MNPKFRERSSLMASCSVAKGVPPKLRLFSATNAALKTNHTVNMHSATLDDTMTLKLVNLLASTQEMPTSAVHGPGGNVDKRCDNIGEQHGQNHGHGAWLVAQSMP